MVAATTALHFVYNANSGTLNAVKDSLHKFLSPGTYECDLCALTHDSIGENNLWKQFRKKADIAMYFHHKDEFNKKFRSKWLPKYDFPLVLIAYDGGLEIFIDAPDLQALNTTQALIDTIAERIKHFP